MIYVKTKKIFATCIIFTSLLTSCVTQPPVVIPSWDNASLVAEQRAEIERLRQELANMAKHQHEISRRIDAITNELTTSIARSDTIEAIFSEIEIFVRAILEENRKLREIQRTDRGANAVQ